MHQARESVKQQELGADRTLLPATSAAQVSPKAPSRTAAETVSFVVLSTGRIFAVHRGEYRLSGKSYFRLVGLLEACRDALEIGSLIQRSRFAWYVGPALAVQGPARGSARTVMQSLA